MEDKRFIGEGKLENMEILLQEIASYRWAFFAIFIALLLLGGGFIYGLIYKRTHIIYDWRTISILVILTLFLILMGWSMTYYFNHWQVLRKDDQERQVLLYHNTIERLFMRKHVHPTIHLKYEAPYMNHAKIPETLYQNLHENQEVIVVVGKHSNVILDIYTNHSE